MPSLVPLLRSTQARLIPVLLSILITSTPLVDAETTLPDLGDQTASISPQQEYKLGRAYERSFRGSVPTLSDPLVSDYLEHLLYRLAFNTPLNHPDLSIVLIDSTDINAFAVPGGFVGFNVGVFLYADNEAQLAGVLAHELGHLKQRHYARMLANTRHDMWWYLAALAAAVALSSKSYGDPGMGAIAGTQAALAQQQLHYSRQYEQEADRIGLQTLVNAHIDPNAMPAFFQKLMQITQGGLTIPAYLQDHPLTSERIADTAARAAQFHVHYPDDSIDFELMKVRSEAFYSSDPKTTLNNLHLNLSGKHPDQSEQINRYYAAELDQKLNHLDAAEQLARSLISSDPHRIAYVYLLGELLIQDHKAAEALLLLNHELDISPDSVPVTLLDVDALNAAGNYAKALPLLENMIEQRPDDPDVWSRMQDTATGLKDNIGVFRAKAELYYLNGDDQHAIEQMQYGLQAAGNNYPTRARFEVRLRQMMLGHQDLKGG